MIILNQDATAKFDINILGETTGQTYIGTFEVNCVLSPLEEIELDKTYRSLLGEVAINLANQRAKDLAFALSMLKVRLTDYPPFWDGRFIGGENVKDYNVLFEIADLAVKAANMYNEKQQKEVEEIRQKLTKAIKTKRIKKEVKEEDEVEENQDVDEL